ncbi:Ig domain-containing protein [Nonomuraea fuscirosea]|uniref:Ig domain-containing protein n=1 Tax=Nonomuraea fuscirosea TaxID=1291556 RepID=UPI003431C9E7
MAALLAEGTSRLMMDLPCRLTATGAAKTLTFANAAGSKVFRLAIHSKRGPGADSRHTLRLTTRDAGGATYEQSMPIFVQQDEKTALQPSLPIAFDYRHDTVTGYFGDAGVRTAAEEAVRDWFRFFGMEPFDTVAAGAEPNHLPGDDWQNTADVTNASAYTGMYMHFRGIQTPYSTGYPAANGRYSTRGGRQVAGPLHRSTAMILEYDEANIDGNHHIPGDQPSWDRLSGRSGGWTHLFPTRRWMPTKPALLVAENAGWKLNRNLTPFLEPSITTTSLPQATPGSAYRQTLAAKGGVPFCDWQVTGGSLPAGLALDRFTGAITGTPTAAGTSAFTVQLRDYDRPSTPVSRTFTLTIGAGGGANLAAAATPSPGSGWCRRAARRRSGCWR